MCVCVFVCLRLQSESQRLAEEEKLKEQMEDGQTVRPTLAHSLRDTKREGIRVVQAPLHHLPLGRKCSTTSEV